MADREHHCPFLNRPDSRCAGHFRLAQLEYALEYCFAEYQACPTYLERLRERRSRSNAAAHALAAAPAGEAARTARAVSPGAASAGAASPGGSAPVSASLTHAPPKPRPVLIQITFGAARRSGTLGPADDNGGKGVTRALPAAYSPEGFPVGELAGPVGR